MVEDVRIRLDKHSEMEIEQEDKRKWEKERWLVTSHEADTSHLEYRVRPYLRIAGNVCHPSLRPAPYVSCSPTSIPTPWWIGHIAFTALRQKESAGGYRAYHWRALRKIFLMASFFFFFLQHTWYIYSHTASSITDKISHQYNFNKKKKYNQILLKNKLHILWI